MKAHEFLAAVRDRGNYKDQAEAQRVTAAVLGILGERLAGGEPTDLASQLPQGIGELVAKAQDGAASFGVEEFLRRVAAAVDGSPETAQWDASAVLCTVTEAVTGGQLNQILTQLQPAYATLFGKPELS
ncbi:hypothetical protein MDOR_37070 [Mycolicibacterium doricum]|uniref:DUF2267 domain-containing protein n=1 Tax=Mycolicibacterium doricum TaxID=126673 RepID=A0A1X1T0F4_9MYCO|nr:DUF2267 domain-containing protein [Mycolicibacterium doricum]MCV7269736.1 DUF2267 domain-containing protein [Mycolicibacterium doricum]ORV37658.1 hypothetical protein AWC01_15545 [Mycolicibacterium doricum]BBZ09538.1 hypothetical protein MDOR_37070 [Mycolicibacterium doricum]